MNCPICGSKISRSIKVKTKEIEARGNEIFICSGCTVFFAENYKEDRKKIYSKDYAAWHKSENYNEEQVSKSKKESFGRQLNNLLKYIDPKNKRVLDIGTGNGYLLEVAREAGFDCYGTEISPYSREILEIKFPGKIFLGKLEDARYEEKFFDAIFLTDVLEHLSDPAKTLKEISRIIKPGGLIFIISPNTKSFSRNSLGKNWPQYKYEHVFYYNKKSLNYLLKKNDFEIIEFKNNIKSFSLNYYRSYFKKYRFIFLGKLIEIIFPFIPKILREFIFPNPITGEFLAIARKK